VQYGRRHLSVGTGIAVVSVVVAACGSAPATDESSRAGRTTTSTTDSVTSSSVQPATGIAVPDVIGQKVAAARDALRGAGLRSIGLNVPCTKGTTASESVVDSLALAGRAPTPDAGAIGIEPGTKVPPGTRIGIRWSGCYGNAVVVPEVVGLSLAGAKHSIKGAGLTWACFSIEKPTTPTSATSSTSTTASSASSTTSPTSPTSTTSSLPPTTSTTTTSTTIGPVSPTTLPPPGVVLSQDPRAGGVLRPGATVALTMRSCPQ